MEGSDVYISEAYRSKVENLRKLWIYLSLCIEKASIFKIILNRACVFFKPEIFGKNARRLKKDWVFR